MAAIDRHVDDTLDLIGEASTDASLWADVTERLLHHTSAAAGAIYVQSDCPREDEIRPTEFAHMVGYEAGWIDRYFQHYAALNPYLYRPEFQRNGVTMTERGRQSPITAMEWEFVHDWQEAQGFHHVIAQFLQKRAEGRLTLVYWRDRTAGTASDDEQRIFDQLARAANRAVVLGDRLRQATSDLENAKIALDHLEAGVVTLNRDGRVRDTNRAADALLRSRDGIKSSWGRLEATHPSDQPALARLLADVLVPSHCADAEQRDVALRRADGKAPLRVQAIAVHHRLPSFAPDQQVAAVVTLRTAQSPHMSPALLARRFGLTPAEARLAALLTEPVSVSEAAGRLGIGRETARTQLKALFAKTGTGSQAALIVRLLSEGRA